MRSAATRRYHSPLRAEQAAATRTAILEAGTRLFDERGWQVGVREIASAAGCSVETVYSGFGSKLGLLLECMDTRVVGDQAQVPLADRPEFRALGQGTRQQRVSKVAQFALGMHQRTAGSQLALHEAARVDPQAAEAVRAMNTRIATSQRQLCELLFGREPDEQELIDAAVIGSVTTYRVLTEERGLSADQYVDWMRRHLDQLTRTRRTKR